MNVTTYLIKVIPGTVMSTILRQTKPKCGAMLQNLVTLNSRIMRCGTTAREHQLHTTTYINK